MFMARLDEAKQGVRDEVKESSVSHGHLSKPGDTAPAALTQNIARGHEADDYDDEEGGILEKCSEYLFDLFDANLMPDYQEMNKIQEKAIKSFIDSFPEDDYYGDHKAAEYTFAQQDLHREFVDRFESLIGDFLKIESISVDQLLREVQIALKQPGISQRKVDLAHEITECIDWYCSFESWAKSMREEAMYRRRQKENTTSSASADFKSSSTFSAYSQYMTMESDERSYSSDRVHDRDGNEDKNSIGGYADADAKPLHSNGKCSVSAASADRESGGYVAAPKYITTATSPATKHRLSDDVL